MCLSVTVAGFQTTWHPHKSTPTISHKKKKKRTRDGCLKHILPVSARKHEWWLNNVSKTTKKWFFSIQKREVLAIVNVVGNKVSVWSCWRQTCSVPALVLSQGLSSNYLWRQKGLFFFAKAEFLSGGRHLSLEKKEWPWHRSNAPL